MQLPLTYPNYRNASIKRNPRISAHPRHRIIEKAPPKSLPRISAHPRISARPKLRKLNKRPGAYSFLKLVDERLFKGGRLFEGGRLFQKSIFTKS